MLQNKIQSNFLLVPTVLSNNCGCMNFPSLMSTIKYILFPLTSTDIWDVPEVLEPRALIWKHAWNTI